MTDKVQKIREEVERLMYGFNLEADIASCEDAETEELANIKYQLCKKILDYIDKVQEEPVSENLERYINELSKQFPEVSFAKLSRIAVRVSRWQQNQDVKNKLPKVTDRTELDEYAYQCAYNMSNDWAIDNPTWHDVEDACKLGAKWQKQQDSIQSKDLEELINTLSKRYPEVSFAKLSRIAVKVAKWQKQKEYTCYEEAFEDGAKWKKEQLMKDAISAKVTEIYYPTGSCLEIEATLPESRFKDGDEVLIIKND